MAEERQVEIRRLVLRMHGTDQGRAARLAREVGERMAGVTPDESARPSANIHVKVEAGTAQPESVLAERVATAIRKALQ